MGIERNVQNYFEALAALPSQVEVTGSTGETLALAAFYESAIVLFRAAHERGNKVMFVGNGGSAANCEPHGHGLEQERRHSVDGIQRCVGNYMLQQRL